MDISYPEKVIYQTPEISIYSDFNKKNVFYYQPMKPSIVKDCGMSVFSLLIYRSMESINGGNLAFDVELPIAVEAIDQAKKYLLEKTGQSDIELRPLLLNDSSKVHIDFIGSQTSGSTSSYSLVKSVQSTYRPSGYGSNRVSFSISLDKYGVALVRRYIGHKLPLIGITYELSFPALRKCYFFKASIDWTRVLHYFEKSFSLGLIFFSIDISNAYKELVDKKTIVIEKNDYKPGTGSDLKAERQRFEDDIVSFLCKSFFVPVTIPNNNAVPILGFSYKTVDVKEVDSKFGSFISEEREVSDSFIYPQAFLENIIPDDISQYIKYIDLDESFFLEKYLTIMTNANYDSDNIKYIQVELLYTDKQPKSIILNNASELQKLSWPVSTDNTGKADKNINYSFTVFFRDNSLINTGKVSSGSFSSQSDVIIIDPHVLYSIRRIEFCIPSVTIWEKYTSIVIEAYWEEKSLPEKSFNLSKEASSCIWEALRMLDDSKYYNYRLYYKEVDSSCYKAASMQKSFEDRIVITNLLA